MAKAHPPQPRLALRVGVTGHQPEDLHRADTAALKKQIHAVLEVVKKFATEHSHAGRYYREPGKPILRVISSLAEGADRYVAHEAIALGYELQCPLPFSREEYSRDFNSAKGSLHEFNELLDDRQTTALLELDGTRGGEPESYLAASRVVLSQSDVFLAIWNGQEAAAEGRTALIVSEAGFRNIPTIRIDSVKPHDVFVRLSNEKWVCSQDASAWLLDQLRVLLTPPHLPKTVEEDVLATVPKDYFSESKAGPNWGFAWIPFRNLVADHRLQLPVFRVPDFVQSGRREWESTVRKSAAFSEGARRLIDRSQLFDHYGWANGLAEYYGNLYRSAFLFNYSLGALAVLFGFLHFALEEGAKYTGVGGCINRSCLFLVHHLPHFHDVQHLPWKVTLISIEFALLLTIVQIYRQGRRRRWHERWIDYRLLAEYLRQLFFLIPLGPGELSSPHLPKYLSEGDPKNTWMYWHYQALRREAGLVSAEFSGPYLESVRSFLNGREGIRGQIHYHEKNTERLEKLDSRFATFGTVLFTIAIAAAIFAIGASVARVLSSVYWLSGHPIQKFLRWYAALFEKEGMKVSVGLCATVLPAFGAALAGLRSQGEFERVKKRSKAMQQTLRRISRALEARRSTEEGISYASLSLIVAEAGQLMVDELLDWRIVFKDRPLPEPG
jgi:hypothetical protein